MALVERIRGTPTLAGYLGRLGVDRPGDLGVERLVELVAGPASSLAAPAADAEDWLQIGNRRVMDLFGDHLFGASLVPEGTRCAGEPDVGKAVSMTLISTGRNVRGDASLPADGAIKAAERHMRISLGDYLARAIGLWRHAPWSIAFAVVDRQRVASSMLLPPEKSAYQQIKSGAQCSHAIAAADLLLPSRSIFVEALGERLEYQSPGRRTLHLLRTIYLQIAHLSMEERFVSSLDKSLQILSLSGSPSSAKRLRSLGYLPTGTRMNGFNIPLMELDERRALPSLLVADYLQRKLHRPRIASR